MIRKVEIKSFWFIFCIIISGFCQTYAGTENSYVHLTYVEDGATFISGTAPKVGSHVNLGIYPHWCVGNINKCNNGTTVSFWIKPIPSPETSPEVIVFSTGGHSYFSEGVYLLQTFGNQYEFGIAKGNKSWKQNFRLIPDLWSYIFATWNGTIFELHIDDVLLNRTTSVNRYFENDTFDPFTEVIVGLYQDGTSVEEERFDLKDIVVYNTVVDFTNISIDQNGYYLGCKKSLGNDQQNTYNVSLSANPVLECRQRCESLQEVVVEMQDSSACKCSDVMALKSVVDVCDNTTWAVYSVSGLDGANSYRMTLSVKQLHQRPYVKPLETVYIQIQTSFTAVENLKVNFGDGEVVLSNDKQISHSWKKEGIYKVTVSTNVGLLPVEGSLNFIVQDVDEGVPPEMAIVSATHLMQQKSAEVEMLSFGEYETKCSVSLDSETIYTKDGILSYYNRFVTDYTYRSYGRYVINSTCSNNYGKTMNSTEFTALLFDIPFLYFNANNSFKFEIIGLSLLDDLTMTRNENEIVNLIGKKDMTGITLSSLDLLPYENIISIKSEGATLIKQIFYVQNALKEATIASDQRSNAWQHTTNISISIPTGLETFVRCSFTVGESLEFYVDKSNETLVMVFEIEYPVLGYYPILVDTANDISTTHVEDLISVEVPIISITIHTYNITDKTLPVVLSVNLNEGQMGPDKVEFQINHGDGNTDEISYRSKSQLFTTFQDQYVYKDWGIYTICVTARNQITEVYGCTLVQVGQNLTYVDLQTATTGRVLTSDYAEVNISLWTGSDVTYEINFGDRIFVFTDLELLNMSLVTSAGKVIGNGDYVTSTNDKLNISSVEEDGENSTNQLNSTFEYTSISTMKISTSTALPNTSLETNTDDRPLFYARRMTDEIITVGHLYRNPGKYRVKVEVRNAFSTLQVKLCQSIIVSSSEDKDCMKPNVAFQDMTSSFQSPIQRIRSLEFNITVLADSTCVPDNQFLYSWKANKFYGEKERQINEICLMEVTENVLVIPAVYLSYGLYRLTVSVVPISNDLRASQKFIYLNITASNPYAEIAGEKETSFLIYAKAVFDVSSSRDPDLVEHSRRRSGLEYDLFCAGRSDFTEMDAFSLNELKQRAITIFEGVMYENQTSNPVKIYDYKDCFVNVGNLSQHVSLIHGRISFPAEYFSSDEYTFKLFVSKEGRINSTTQEVKIRLTNSTDIGSQMSAMAQIKDCGSLLRAVAVVSGEFLNDGKNSTEDAEEELTEVRAFMTNLLDNLADKTENVDQCKGVASAVADLTSNPDQTSSAARTSGGSAIKKSMNSLGTNFGDSSYSTVVDVAGITLDDNYQTIASLATTIKYQTTFIEHLPTFNKLLAVHGNLQVNVFHSYTTGMLTSFMQTDYTSAVGGMSNLLPREDKAEAERRKRRKRREAPNIPAEVGLAESEQDSFDRMIEEEDAITHKYFDEFYEYVFIFKKAFRGAVRKYWEEMWLSESVLKEDKETFFKRVIIEWEPFDVEKYLNHYCQVEKKRLDLEKLSADKDVATASEGAVDSISNLVLGKMEASRRRRKRRSLAGNGTQAEVDNEGEDDVNQECKIESERMALGMLNADPDSAEPPKMESDGGGFVLSDENLPKSEDGSGVGITFTAKKQNDLTWDETSDIKSSVVSLEVSTDGSKVKVNNTKPMKLVLKGNPEQVHMYEWVICVPRGVSPTDATEWNNHLVAIPANDTALHFLLWPEREGDKFNVYFKYQTPPNATHYDYKTTMPHDPEDLPNSTIIDSEVYNQMLHTFFPPQHLTTLNGTYYVSIGIAKTDVDFGSSETCLNYSTQTFNPSCKFWHKETETWKADGCKVGNETTKWNTECFCDHLTSFGGDFAVPPNTIDFSNVWAKFKNLDENAAVFSTVVALIGIYILLLVWSRYMDKQDIIKWGATPLEDNLPSDNYHYQVTVQTGMRKKAGTTSKISFIMSGENCDSGVRRLYDGHRKELTRGSILNYICSVENPLGALTFMRIWHDNSGKGKNKSWFLDQVQVTDLQTGDRYIFLCDRWLALEEDDGMVDRILPVAGLEDLAAFKQLFSSNVRKKLTNEHLWFSVFSRPTRSHFTRAQRISCCMSLLFMTMITNAMWFKSDDKAKQTNALKVGPISFTLQQLFVSFASTMIVFPVNFILITFFKKCRPKQNAVLQSNQNMPKRGKWKNVTNGSQIWGDAAKPSRWKNFKDYVSDLVNFKQKAKYGADDNDPDDDDKPQMRIVGVPEDEKEKKKKKKKPGTLPHWCLYFAWVLCFLSIFTAGFFTILYSLEWGKEKANEWLTTFMMSFFQSVIVVQPIKVLCIVAFIACILKKPSLDEEDASEDLNNVIAAHDEEFLGKTDMSIEEIASKRKEANAEFQPPDPATLEEARQARIMELKMEEVLKELVAYIFFVIILFFLSYQQRDSASFTYAENLKTTFTSNFQKVSTVDQYWAWMEKNFIPSLYATHYANGTKIRRWWDKRCISDLESRRVGIPRLRQLRVKPDTCKVNPYLKAWIHHCRDEYGWTDDDAKIYLPRWQKASKENITEIKKLKNPGPWAYQSSLKLANAPYMATVSTYKGGGYVYMFERAIERTKASLSSLKNQIWMDAHTRAIFVEFTVYNPNINLFGSMIIMTEFLSTGGTVPRVDCKVFRLLSYVGGFGVLVLLVEVIYALFTLYFFIRCIRKVKKDKLKYFKEFWNKLEFALLVFCVAVIAMYAFKQILTSMAINALKDPEKADYVNFQSLALYDEMYGWMCGFVVFLATVQFLKLLQFNKKMSMLGETVQYATKDLKVFSIAFLLYFWTFTATGFLLFSNTMIGYSNVVGSAESMFAFTLGSFDFVAMQESQPFLGPIFFFLFIGIVYVGLMSIFLTIIADAFSTVKEQLEGKQNEYELLEYVTKRLKGIMGFA